MNAIEEQRLFGPIMPLALGVLSLLTAFSSPALVFLCTWVVGVIWTIASFAKASRLGTSKAMLVVALVFFLAPVALLVLGGLMVSH